MLVENDRQRDGWLGDVQVWLISWLLMVTDGSCHRWWVVWLLTVSDGQWLTMLHGEFRLSDWWSPHDSFFVVEAVGLLSMILHGLKWLLVNPKTIITHHWYLNYCSSFITTSHHFYHQSSVVIIRPSAIISWLFIFALFASINDHEPS